MSRDNFDIPEVFRRAMEDAGWGGSGQGEGGERRPSSPNASSQRPNRLLILVSIFFILFISLNWIVFTYTDWLWFNDINYESVWLQQWWFRIGSFLTAFVAALLFLLLNWQIARRRAIKETPPFNPKFLQIKLVGRLITGAAVALSFGFAVTFSSNWETILRYVYRVPFGESDPVFNRDIGFYLFELPFFEQLQQWTISLLVITILGAAGIYALNNIFDIQRGKWQPQHSNVLRRHLALLLGLLLLLMATGYIFNLFNLLYSSRGVVFGASYTDLNVSLYAIYAQMAAVIVLALTVFFNILRFDYRPVALGAAAWVLITLVGGGILPGIVQRYSVDPNEIRQESPFLAHNIALTRLAFGLNEVEVRPFENLTDLTPQDLAENQDILDSVRLWDYRPLETTYDKLQTLRPIYQFNDVDIDRYEINGRTEQVMLSVRELNKPNLSRDSWVNEKLEFTHGYGVVMNPVNQLTEIGQPKFYIKDLPPQSVVDIEITRPEIYYGELTNDVVLVGSERDEYDYPQSPNPVYSRYEGEGGVQLSSGFLQLLFALRYGEVNILLNSEINSETQIQMHRNIQERIRKITPYLKLDTDPYIVIWNGRLVWIQDAYTISDRFPYSEPLRMDDGRRINYIRNSVKITVDAYNGTVNYYVFEPDDPIIQTYQKAFPNLFQPMSALPQGLERHIRYPETLFDIQALQYLKYHVTNERVFYNEEDVWDIPLESFDDANATQPMEPYYILSRLPGEEMLEYLLILPFEPRGDDNDNMVAWLAARSDGEQYGKLIVYELPRQQFVEGPGIIEGRIAQDPEISEQFSLWDVSGSQVIRGNLLAIPINNNFLFVEPIYLQSTSENAVPELKRVIVGTNQDIVMAETLEGAISALFLDDDVEEIIVASPDEDTTVVTIPDDAAATPEASPAPAPNATIQSLIESANAHFEAAQAAQRAGDWSTYGAEIEALEQDLARLAQLVDQSE